jgi:hypothetical protein
VITEFCYQNEYQVFVILFNYHLFHTIISKCFNGYLFITSLQDFSLIFLKSVPKLVRLYPKQEQSEGSRFHVVCATQEGSDPLFFTWAKNGQTIKSRPDVNYKIENSEMFSTFAIRKLNRNDAANYTCTVSNSIGSDSLTVVLTIKGRIIVKNLNNFI